MTNLLSGPLRVARFNLGGLAADYTLFPNGINLGVGSEDEIVLGAATIEIISIDVSQATNLRIYNYANNNNGQAIYGGALGRRHALTVTAGAATRGGRHDPYELAIPASITALTAVFQVPLAVGRHELEIEVPCPTACAVVLDAGALNTVQCDIHYRAGISGGARLRTHGKTVTVAGQSGQRADW